MSAQRTVTVLGDRAFLLERGAEILFETSRFWVERAVAAEAGTYSLLRVMGPDEFHSHIDDNAFTNHLVRWHLETAAAVYDELSDTEPAALAALADAISVLRKAGTASSGSSGNAMCITAEVAKQAMAAVDDINGDRLRPLLVYMARTNALDRAAREHFAQKSSASAIALLGVTSVDRLLAAVALSHGDAPVPAQYFTDENDAIARLLTAAPPP